MIQKTQGMPDDELIKAILTQKIELEKRGHKPRLIILGSAAFESLERDWFEDVGESLGADISMRNRLRNRTAGDGLLFDLVVFKVDTIEGFEVR